MTCPLCNDTGDQRYWEGRWRDEKADNERLRTALKELVKWVRPSGYAPRRYEDAMKLANEALNDVHT